MWGFFKFKPLKSLRNIFFSPPKQSCTFRKFHWVQLAEMVEILIVKSEAFAKGFNSELMRDPAPTDTCAWL